MKIEVRVHDGRTIEFLRIDDYSTITRLRAKYLRRLAKHPDTELEMAFAGRRFDFTNNPTARLSNLGVQEGSLIMVVWSAEGG